MCNTNSAFHFVIHVVHTAQCRNRDSPPEERIKSSLIAPLSLPAPRENCCPCPQSKFRPMMKFSGLSDNSTVISSAENLGEDVLFQRW